MMQKRLKRRRIDTEVQVDTRTAETRTSRAGAEPVPTAASTPPRTRRACVYESAAAEVVVPESTSHRSALPPPVTAGQPSVQEASLRTAQPVQDPVVVALQHQSRDAFTPCVEASTPSFNADTANARSSEVLCDDSTSASIPAASTPPVQSYEARQCERNAGVQHQATPSSGGTSVPPQPACTPPTQPCAPNCPSHQPAPRHAPQAATPSQPSSSPSNSTGQPPPAPPSHGSPRSTQAGTPAQFTHSWSSPVEPSSSVPGAIHFHLPLNPDRISQLSSATPEDMRAITNFFTQLVQRVMPTAPGPPPWHPDAPTPDFKLRWERFAVYFMSLPLQTYYDRPALEKMTVRELKDVVSKRELSTAGLLEKADLVNKLLEGTDTSSSCESCPICSESYVAGEDVIRVLPCKHCFHVECVDTWFRNPVDYSRRPCCPMCKAELPLPD